MEVVRQVNSAIRMMIGMGIPRKNKSSERMAVSLGEGAVAEDQRSRCRPPQVAARLATKAPASIETKSHSVA
jgi:hypothetical protein